MKKSLIALLMSVVIASVNIAGSTAYAAEPITGQEEMEAGQSTVDETENSSVETDAPEESGESKTGSDTTGNDSAESDASSGNTIATNDESDDFENEDPNQADTGNTGSEETEEAVDEEETDDLEGEDNSTLDETLPESDEVPEEVQSEIPEESESTLEFPGGSVDVSIDSSEDELLGQYMDSQLLQGKSGSKKKSPRYGENLDYLNRELYSMFSSDVESAAAGHLNSAKFILRFDDIYLTNDLLGIDLFTDDNTLKSQNQIEQEALNVIMAKMDLWLIYRTLCYDRPDLMYWGGKKKINDNTYYNMWWDGYSLTARTMTNDALEDGYVSIWVTGEITLYSAVSPNYRDPNKQGSDEYYYSLNTGKIQSVQSSINNAKRIVSNHSGESDYQKLLSYKNEICDRVSYDHSAWGNGHALVEYGDPWQLINVFDGDSSTNVVCEGYSKAFQYLCRMSSFNDDIKCYSVLGKTNFSYDPNSSTNSPGDDHMWNIVRMGDGNTYIADITNCDYPAYDYPDGLFLVGQVGGSVDGGYQVLGKYSIYMYTYHSEMKDLYSDDELTICQKIGGKCGEYLTYTITGTGNNLTLTISGSGDMYDYAYFSRNSPTLYVHEAELPPWVSNDDIRKNINHIIVKEGVTGIGTGAFSYAGSPQFGTKARINEIKLPKSLRRIGWHAFYNTGCDTVTIGSPNNPVKMEYVNPKTGQLLKGNGLVRSNFRKVNICLDDSYGTDFEDSSVENVVFMEGTEIIPPACFRFCEELQSVDIAKSVTSIAGFAFENCNNLTRVGIPVNGNLESIGRFAFSDCNNLNSITLPDHLSLIEQNAFENCTALKSIDIPDSVETIYYNAFNGCTGLQTVKLSSGCTRLQSGVFAGCESIESITIPNGVTEIGNGAFLNCKKLTRIVIPASVDNLAAMYSYIQNKKSAFAGAENLVEIAVDPDNATYKSFDGCLYNSDLTELLYCPEGKTKINFAPSTTTILGSAFRSGEFGDGVSKLKELYFGTYFPGLEENIFGAASINATAYYNNFLNAWPASRRQNYGGVIVWKEKPLNLSDCSISISPTSYSYNGTAKKPTVSLNYGGKTLVLNTNYTIAYKNNINAGNATATVTGKGYFTGTVTKNFIIKKIANAITAKNFSKTYSTKVQAFALGVKIKNGTPTYKSNSKSVTVSKAGKVTVKAKFIGKATITITAPASTNYTATTKKITVTVNPTKTALSSVSSPSAGKMTVKWKKNAVGTGYQIQYSTSSKFTSPKAVTIAKNSTLTRTIGNLVKGKKYYVRIRTYKTVGSTKFYSGWSAAKAVTIKK